MSAALVVVGIALAAAAFMLRFLIALLREGAPSVTYWIVPVRKGPGKASQLKVLGGIYVDGDCCAAERKRSDYYVNLENENYAKEDDNSGLIALDVRPVGGQGWRSIHSRRGYIFSEHRL